MKYSTHRNRPGLAPMEFALAMPILILLVWTISQTARVYLAKFHQTIRARNAVEKELVQQNQLQGDIAYCEPMRQAWISLGSQTGGAGVGRKVLLKDFDARPITLFNQKIDTRFTAIRGTWSYETTPFDNDRSPLMLIDTKRLPMMLLASFGSEASQAQNVLSQLSSAGGLLSNASSGSGVNEADLKQAQIEDDKSSGIQAEKNADRERQRNQ